jgi:hypothetical protein
MKLELEKVEILIIQSLLETSIENFKKIESFACAELEQRIVDKIKEQTKIG